ncbi:unnamed protein product (macronuclear) [Paramecium tetraurelia]|uniref:Uncharacterized protein n=1 Tax=Paramecium tetraurelia TaxID=5888 RepID=A0BW62_PARTE|nr:uncharacterized protein GSPATT00032631001 [Paramecium tetraurelia]CAK62779.1 unnamed protein product [Paramecium tetraurelia]|eukprot:XP_001430177.1 hypothetical protein (macronuclear) [Paramecium tetraurelia strain d4-2]
MKLQTNQICILLLIFMLQKEIIGQVLVDMKNGHCDCEELENELECVIIQKCKFENGKCKSLSCDSLQGSLLAGCYLAKGQGCILNFLEGKCTQFKGCSSYEYKTQNECNLLPTKCYYDSELKRCEDQTQLPSCSEQLQSECFHGKEGICVFKDGKCQEFTKCEDVEKSDKRCQEAYPSCNYISFNLCRNQIGGCNQGSQSSCPNMRETINGENFFLCERKIVDGQQACVDWDPQEQTMDSCLFESQFTHHWKDDQCVKCQPSNHNSSLRLEIVIMLLTLAF